ncbi:LADA_0H08152g1_1 [Lachancea dasiensis]|uniref:LADA_0H08152g1_1 n=1 Tax=Lachancea dasiensis TaxID=1072105 RepID=A0A1G4K2B3_9SACH|nr:LADA_0H08152g1_1 [Lachancea dasiensis]
MSETRRSTRIRDKSSAADNESEHMDSMGLVHMDEDIDFGSDIDRVTVHDSPRGSDGEAYSEEGDDEDYQEPQANKRKRASKKGQGLKQAFDKKSSKRAKVSTSNLNRYSKKSREAFIQMQQDFAPTELFSILANSEDSSLEELANRWLESYSANRTKALQEFVNLLLNCCGSLVQVQEHDVASNDTANETVAEIQIMFQRQELHESYLLLSKTHKRRAKYKTLYQNYMEFMHKLIELANEQGLLYEENTNSQGASQSLMLDLLTWLSSFSVSKIRCLRHIATLCMYSFQDYLTELSVSLENNYLMKLRRQLSLEQKKKRANAKTAEKLESTIAEIEASKSEVEVSIDNIIKLAFVHRFKDVDEDIRADSMVHLATWLEKYPGYFLKVTFLKYFGWLLSDLSSTVRSQVLKVLLEIVRFDSKRSKHKVGSAALRQFFERFKQRIVEISLKDIDMHVRITAIQVLTQINSFGYLDDNDISRVSSLLFTYQKVDISSVARNAKLLSAVAKFFATTQKDKMETLLESHNFPSKSKVLKPHDIVQAGFFMKSLTKALSSHLTDGRVECSEQDRNRLIFQAAEFLEPYFGALIATMCQLLTFEGDFQGFADIMSEEEEGQKALLLPNEDDSITQYTVVLSGLCHGGAIKKNANKTENAAIAIHHLAKLFASLPLHSGIVMHYLFSMYSLFTYEEWVSAHLESEFQQVIDAIVKNFDRSQFTNDESDIKRSSFAHILQFHKSLGIPQINDTWKNQVDQVRIPLQLFLETKADSFEDTDIDELLTNVYELYINKLVLLGKVVPLDFNQEIIRLFFDKVVNRLPLVLHLLENDSVKAVDFKILTLVVTWSLQRWFEILQNNPEASPLSSQVLQMVSNIIHQLAYDLNELQSSQVDELHTLLHINWTMCNTLSDCMIAYKMFELNIPEKDIEWKQAIHQDYPIIVDHSLEQSLLNTFLFLESLRAKELDVQLDRLEGEDVNLNSISDENMEDIERELLVYVVKLKSLLNIGLLGTVSIENRISLNKDALGSTFASIIDETAFSGTAAPKRRLASANHERQVFDDRNVESDQEFETGRESKSHAIVIPATIPATIPEDDENWENASELL